LSDTKSDSPIREKKQTSFRPKKGGAGRVGKKITGYNKRVVSKLRISLGGKGKRRQLSDSKGYLGKKYSTRKYLF